MTFHLSDRSKQKSLINEKKEQLEKELGKPKLKFYADMQTLKGSVETFTNFEKRLRRDFQEMERRLYNKMDQLEKAIIKNQKVFYPKGYIHEVEIEREKDIIKKS